MYRFRNALAVALLVAFAALPKSYAADSIRMTSEFADANSPGCSAGVCIVAAPLTATQYTGWIWVHGFAKATLGVTFVDANDSVTTLDMQCWTDYVATTANGSGYEVCSGATGSGTTTMTCPHSWSLTTGTAEQYTVTVDNLNADYLNCAFSATGTAAAADTVAVKVLRRTP